MESGAWRGFSRPAGLVVGKTLGNGVEYAASFDAANRQVSSDWQNSHHHSLAGYNYAYDAASNRKYEEKVHDPNSSQLYKYDTVYQVDQFKTGRLNRQKTNIPRPDRSQDWNYDPMGNWRQFRDSVDGLQRRDHNEVNEITEITEFGPRRPRHRPSQTRTALSYDANGNLLDDGEYLYAWDAFNRLVEVRLKRNSRIVGQYFYDAMHRRTRRLANLDGNASLETQVAYIYDAFNCISEISNSGSEIKDYVWGNDINGGPQAAGGVGGLVAVIQNGSTHYPLYDARGNVTAYTGSSGSVAASFDYLPFGALASSAGNADAFSYRFSTKPFDPETGLVYYNYRYYSPKLGRWQSKEPLGEVMSDNLYAYLFNNIFKYYDYIGNSSEIITTSLGSKTYELDKSETFKAKGLDDEKALKIRELAGKVGVIHQEKTTLDEIKVEYCGYICCNNPTGRIYHTRTKSTTEKYCEPTVPCNQGDITLALWHTHPDLPGFDPDYFSLEDITFAVGNGILIYVTTPSGKTLEYIAPAIVDSPVVPYPEDGFGEYYDVTDPAKPIPYNNTPGSSYKDINYPDDYLGGRRGVAQ